MSDSKTRACFAVIALSGHLPASVIVPVLNGSHAVHGVAAMNAPCTPATDCAVRGTASFRPALSLPAGMQPCPESGPGAACAAGKAATIAPGESSLPAGMAPCPTPAGKELPLPDAACGSLPLNTRLATDTSLGLPPAQGLSLTADTTTAVTGGKVTLRATASSPVTGTPAAIEIFDTTSGTLAGACGQGSTCTVAYAAAGGTHAFAAFVTSPAAQMPAAGSAVASNVIGVSWLDMRIEASAPLVVPGQDVVITAASGVDVRDTGRSLEIYDLTTQSRVTYCSQGSVCSTSMNVADGETHQLVARLSGAADSVSAPISVTWLTVKLTATMLTQSSTGAAYLQATVNADLAKTPWQLGIYDDHGKLIGHPCSSGMTCAATSWVDAASLPTYTALVSTLPVDQPVAAARDAQRGAGSGRMAGVVAKSAPAQPAHLLWGVDSCKAFTSDPAAAQGLYRQVASRLGAPDFWGRYLTDTWCPGISPNEVAAASANHMGILPIYNDYDCNAVNTYATGAAYAASAVVAAENLGIPRGRGLAIDIEPPGPQCPGAVNVDPGFVKGWFDGVHGAGYVPIYYGNGTAGSEFGNAWCSAVADVPGIATESYLWSFEPSLLGRFRKATAPAYSPYAPGCAARMGAWQYRISDGSDPDVDHDLATSNLPLWFP